MIFKVNFPILQASLTTLTTLNLMEPDKQLEPKNRPALQLQASDSDDDLEEVATLQRLNKPKGGLPNRLVKKTVSANVSMYLFTKRKFGRGWYLNLIDIKRAAVFSSAKATLENLEFSIRKNYTLSLTLYLVPFNSKETTQVQNVPYQEGSILHCTHVTGLCIQQCSGTPKGNVSGTHRNYRRAGRRQPECGSEATIGRCESQQNPGHTSYVNNIKNNGTRHEENAVASNMR